MNSLQFTTGNFNTWEKFVNETLPNANKRIREELPYAIDAILYEMLTKRAVFKRESLDVKEIVDNFTLSGLKVEVSYLVDDFIVPDAPRDAIDADVETIKGALSSFDVKELSIDTKTGKLSIKLEIRFI